MKLEWVALTLCACVLAYAGGLSNARSQEKGHWMRLYEQQTKVKDGETEKFRKQIVARAQEVATKQQELYQESHFKTLKYYEDLRKKQVSICKGIYEDSVRRGNKELLEKYKTP